MADAFADNFVESSETNLDDHVPDTTPGDNWTFLVGSDFALRCETGSTGILLLGGGLSTCFTAHDWGTDHYEAIMRRAGFTASAGGLAVAMDASKNGVDVYLGGTGGAGLRMATIATGTRTTVDSRQGAADEWIKLEKNGHLYDWYYGGTGSTPSWGASEFQYDDTVSQLWSSTAPGLNQFGSSYGGDFAQYFGANNLAAGGSNPRGPLGHPLSGAFGGPIGV